MDRSAQRQARPKRDNWTSKSVLRAIAMLLRNESLPDKAAAAGALALIEVWEEKGARR